MQTLAEKKKQRNHHKQTSFHEKLICNMNHRIKLWEMPQNTITIETERFSYDHTHPLTHTQRVIFEQQMERY